MSWLKCLIKLVTSKSPTWMQGGIVGPQIWAAGGGGGGNPPDVPGNQDVGVSGSADRMVISGRLATGSQHSTMTHTVVYFFLYVRSSSAACYLLSRSLSRSRSLDDSDGGVGLAEATKRWRKHTRFLLLHWAKWTNQASSYRDKYSLLLMAALMDERGPWLEQEVKENVSHISSLLSKITLFLFFIMNIF